MISGQVLGAEQVTARFNSDAAQALPRLTVAVQRSGIELQRLAKLKVSGDVLNVRTGRGRRSVNEETVTEGTSATSTVGTNVGYMGDWERGFSRTVGPGSRGGKLRSKYGLGGQSVKQYAPRSFLVSSLDELRPGIAERLAKALGGTQ